MVIMQDAAVAVQRGFALQTALQDGCVITIGNFDGVHLGHRALIQTAQQMAEGLKVPLVILTFWPHSGDRIPGRKSRRIYTEAQKIALLEDLVPDAYVLQFAFDDDLRTMPEDLFFRDILLDRYHMRGLAVGENFRYGYKGQGTVNTLKAHCEEAGIPFAPVPGVKTGEGPDAERISSTLIRGLLAEGAMEEAEHLLGRPYYAEGRVRHGKRLGRTIGFPTVNLLLPLGLTEPLHGVYLTRVHVPDVESPFYGITNVGLNPTVEHGDRVKIETHILDFQGDVYDRKIRVEFLRFMREEHRFANVEALEQQLRKDTDQAKAWIHGGK